MKTELLDAYRFHRASGRPYPLSASRAIEKAREDLATSRRRYYSPDYGPGTRQPDQPHLMAIHDETGQGAFRHVGDAAPEPRWHSGPWTMHHDRPSGWYTDPHGESARDGTGLCWGVVYQLPGRHGGSRFVAGYQMGGTSFGPMLDLGTIYEEPASGDFWNTDPRDHDAARDAAHAANRMAEHAAEEEREYQAASSARLRFEELGEEIKSNRQTARELRREVKAMAPRRRSPEFPAVFRAATLELGELNAARRKAYEQRQELESDFAYHDGWKDY